jgi:hypothetical protein
MTSSDINPTGILKTHKVIFIAFFQGFLGWGDFQGTLLLDESNLFAG